MKAKKKLIFFVHCTYLFLERLTIKTLTTISINHFQDMQNAKKSHNISIHM